MGRYSPTIVPDFGGEGFSDALARAFEQRDLRKRRETLDDERRKQQRIENAGRGVFEGPLPPDPGNTSITLDRPATVPPDLDLAHAFDPHAPASAPASPLDSENFDAALSTEFARGGPTGSPFRGAGTGQPASPLQEQPDFSQQSRGMPAPIHPGAFDPATRTFGGSPAQFAAAQQHTERTQSRTPDAAPGRSVNLGPTGRYRRIDDTHYIDETATPEARQAAARSAERADERTETTEAKMTELLRTAQTFVAAGATPAEAMLLARTPALADEWYKAHNPELLPKPTATPDSVRLQSRIAELQKGGMSLADASAKARLEFGKTPPLESSTVVQTPDGYVHVGSKTHTVTPLKSEDGSPLQAKAPAQFVQSVVENRKQLGVIDAALQLLEKHPAAVGFVRGRVDAADQRLDPDGVATRAAIADVGSLEIRDRSGAAVTAAEWPRLAPFIPRASDTPEAARTKLRRMKAIIARETEMMEIAYPGLHDAAGVSVPPANPYRP